MNALEPGRIVYWLLSGLAWLCVNTLAGVGAVVLLFVLMANATWQGLFTELAGLSRHFLDAPAASRAAFEGLAARLILAAVTLISLSRWSALRAALRGPSESQSDA